MINPLEDSAWEPRPKKRPSPWPYLLLACALGFAAYRSGGVQSRLNAFTGKYFANEARGLFQRATAQGKALQKTLSIEQAEPPPELAKVWTIRVKAYDLRALKPVKGLSVKLKGGGKVFAPRAKGGALEFEVPRVEEGGYLLDVRLRGKPVLYIEDIGDVPYRDHDDERRAQEYDELKTERILHAALRAEDVSGKLDCPIVVLP